MRIELDHAGAIENGFVVFDIGKGVRLRAVVSIHRGCRTRVPESVLLRDEIINFVQKAGASRD